jgi:hypothetical protein
MNTAHRGPRVLQCPANIYFQVWNIWIQGFSTCIVCTFGIWMFLAVKNKFYEHNNKEKYRLFSYLFFSCGNVGFFANSMEDSHRHHIFNYSLRQCIYYRIVRKLMLCPHSKFRLCIPNVSLVIAIKPKAKYSFYAEAISYSTGYHKAYKLCILHKYLTIHNSRILYQAKPVSLAPQ